MLKTSTPVTFKMLLVDIRILEVRIPLEMSTDEVGLSLISFFLALVVRQNTLKVDKWMN